MLNAGKHLIRPSIHTIVPE